jgi:predicted oxidoreductase
VADVALFTRVILLQFFKNDGFSEESMELISDLKSLQNESLTQIATSILKHRPEMEENYAANYKHWKKRFAKRFVGTNVSRIGQHCAIVMAIYQTLSSKMNFPFVEDELRISLEKIAEAQNGMMQNSEESSQFWEAMTYLVHSGILEENRQFTFRELNAIAVRKDSAKSETIVNFAQTTEVVFIRLNQIQPVYAKEMRQRGQKYMDSDTLRSYLKNSPAYIGEKKSMKFGESNSSAMVFNYTILQDDFSIRKISYMADTSESQLAVPDHLPEVEYNSVPF